MYARVRVYHQLGDHLEQRQGGDELLQFWRLESERRVYCQPLETGALEIAEHSASVEGDLQEVNASAPHHKNMVVASNKPARRCARDPARGGAGPSGGAAVARHVLRAADRPSTSTGQCR